MKTVKIVLRNTDEAAIQSVLDFVLTTLEKEGMKNNIVSAEIEYDDQFEG